MEVIEAVGRPEEWPGDFGMSVDRSTVIVLLAIAIVGWVAAIATRQAERYYDRKGPNAAAWYWLRLFRIPTTRRNCARFVNMTYVMAMTACAIAIVMLRS